MLKKSLFIGVIVAVFLVVLIPVTAMAAEEESTFEPGYTDEKGVIDEQDDLISVQYTNINQVSTSLTISTNGLANVYGYVQRTPSGEYIYINSTLQRYASGSWVDVKNWSKSTTSWSALVSENYYVSTRGIYRVKTYYLVRGSNGYENGNIYSKEVYF